MIGNSLTKIGETVASIEEVKGAASGALEQLRGMWANLEGARNTCTEIGGQTAAVLQGSGREDAAAAVSRVRSCEMNLDDAIANCGIAVEQLEQLIAAL